MTRAEAGRKLCARLATDIGRIAPSGLGLRDSTWEAVDPATAEFWIALSRWEQVGTEVARLEIRDRYRDVLDAWREASRQYREEASR